MYGYDYKVYSQLTPPQKRFMDALQNYPPVLGYNKVSRVDEVDLELQVDVESGQAEWVLDYAYELASDLNFSIILPSTDSNYVDFILSIY